MSAPKPDAVLRNSEQARARVRTGLPLHDSTLAEVTEVDTQPESGSFINASYTPHQEEESTYATIRSRSNSFAKRISNKNKLNDSCNNPKGKAVISVKPPPDKKELLFSQFTEEIEPTSSKFYPAFEEPKETDDADNFEAQDGFSLDYHGILSKSDCEQILLKDGEYIVRKSSTKKNAENMIISLR